MGEDLIIETLRRAILRELDQIHAATKDQQDEINTLKERLIKVDGQVIKAGMDSTNALQEIDAIRTIVNNLEKAAKSKDPTTAQWWLEKRKWWLSILTIIIAGIIGLLTGFFEEILKLIVKSRS